LMEPIHQNNTLMYWIDQRLQSLPILYLMEG